MNALEADDFIGVYPDALDASACAAIIERFDASDALGPGRVGGGVMPELKDSTDLSITGRQEWQDIDQSLNQAVFGGLLQYLRRWPQALISPLMLQTAGADGTAAAAGGR
jgi:hypothetical protein